MRAWRGVEAQHRVATMRLVDTLDEQALLEQLLENSKPPLPALAQATAAQHEPSPHYLLSTPFRYRSPWGSRFRRPFSPGVWYGAAALRTACAEVAYWRWRFVCDSAGLSDEAVITEHTLFRAQVQGLHIDLAQPPWAGLHSLWTADRDYSHTQTVGESARQRGLGWLAYASVRDPGGRCAAVFDVAALALPGGVLAQQTWACKTTRHGAWMSHGQGAEEGWGWGFAAQHAAPPSA